LPFRLRPAKGACPSRQGQAAALSFKHGSVLYTLNTVETLRDKIRQGEQVRRHLLVRRSKGTANKGLTTEDINLSHCECLLLDLFTEMFNINKD
jgi:hypothetical protein